MKIVGIADIHEHLGGLDSFSPVIEMADLVIIAGDLTQFGGSKEAKEVIREIKALNRNIIAVPGNTDHPSVAAYLDDEGMNIHGKGVTFGEIGVFGIGGSNITPFSTPFEIDDEKIGEIAEHAFDYVRTSRVKVMVCHVPPYGCGLDRIWAGTNVGSRSVASFITREKPDIVITGHIHEARGEKLIGPSLVINTGPFAMGGYADLDLDGCESEGKLRVLDIALGTKALRSAQLFAGKIIKFGKKKANPS